MSVKVIDLNNEEVKEEAPALEAIEEAPKEEEPEIMNEAIEEVNEEPKEEVNEEKPKPKRQTQKDKIQCPKCFKEMTVKSYRYSHEKNCGGKLSDKPVKPHTNPKPKAKQQPKPKVVPEPPPEVYYSESSDDEVPQQPLIKKKQKQPAQPPNPLLDITNQYALLHQQLMHQKQEKYNKVCAGMFAPRTKKR